MRKLLNRLALAAAGVAGVVLPSVARAEGESSQIDLSAATTAMQTMSDAVKGWISSSSTYIVAILGAALLITVIFIAYKWIRKGTNKA